MNLEPAVLLHRSPAGSCDPNLSAAPAQATTRRSCTWRTTCWCAGRRWWPGPRTTRCSRLTASSGVSSESSPILRVVRTPSRTLLIACKAVALHCKYIQSDDFRVLLRQIDCLHMSRMKGWFDATSDGPVQHRAGVQNWLAIPCWSSDHGCTEIQPWNRRPAADADVGSCAGRLMMMDQHKGNIPLHR